MKLPGWLKTTLTTLTNLLNIGRSKGWWDRGQGPGAPQR